MSDTEDHSSREIWYYDQLSNGIRGQPHGYCAGMVICWIMLRTGSHDFQTIPHRSGDTTITLSDEQKALIGAYQDQHVADTQQTEYSKTTGYGQIFSSAHDGGTVVVEKGFNLNASGVAYSTADLSSIANHVSARTIGTPSMEVSGEATGFFILRFRSVGSTGHVVALEVKGTDPGRQRFRLMDPSQGCRECVSLAKFDAWLCTEYLKNSGYLQLYDKRIKVQQVMFPSPDPLNLIGLKMKSAFDSIGGFFGWRG